MSKQEYSNLMIALAKELKRIWNNDNFILGVMSDVWYSAEDQQTLLDFIRSGKDVNVETVSVLAMELGDARET